MNSHEKKNCEISIKALHTIFTSENIKVMMMMIVQNERKKNVFPLQSAFIHSYIVSVFPLSLSLWFHRKMSVTVNRRECIQNCFTFLPQKLSNVERKQQQKRRKSRKEKNLLNNCYVSVFQCFYFFSPFPRTADIVTVVFPCTKLSSFRKMRSQTEAL